MKTIELNYMELAFLMNIETKEAKEIFMNHLDKEKVNAKDLISSEVLQKHFKPIKSLDARYDGVNELVLNIALKPSLYKKYLNEKSFIKNKKFSCGKTVFYKLLNESQLRHVEEVAKYKHNYVYNRDSSF